MLKTHWFSTLQLKTKSYARLIHHHFIFICKMFPNYCGVLRKCHNDQAGRCAHNDLTIYTWNTNAIEYNENSACWCQFNHNFSFNWLVNLSVVVADSFANYEGKDKSLWREPATCAESTLGLVGSRQSFSPTSSSPPSSSSSLLGLAGSCQSFCSETHNFLFVQMFKPSFWSAAASFVDFCK